MRRVFSAFLVSAAVASGVVWLSGCTGPEGPQGPAGASDTVIVRDTLVIKDTLFLRDSLFIHDTLHNIDTVVRIDTVRMTMACQQCHNSGSDLLAKQYEWRATKHAAGLSFEEEGGIASCARCHNGAAFYAALTGRTLTSGMLASPTPVTCRSCHLIHTDYDSTDWALTITDTTRLIIDTTRKVDFGKGNLCASCHQTRTDPMAGLSRPSSTCTLLVDKDSVKFTSSAVRLSAHYGAQAEVLAAVGVWRPDGATTSYRSPHMGAVSNGCVTCHMGQKQHDLEPAVATCKTCHATATTFDIARTQTRFDSLAAIVIDSLVSKGLVKADSTSPIGYALDARNEIHSKQVVGAWVNWQLLAWDGSRGVHNPAFSLYLLSTSLDSLRQ